MAHHKVIGQSLCQLAWAPPMVTRQRFHTQSSPTPLGPLVANNFPHSTGKISGAQLPPHKCDDTVSQTHGVDSDKAQLHQHKGKEMKSPDVARQGCNAPTLWGLNPDMCTLPCHRPMHSPYAMHAVTPAKLEGSCGQGA